MEDWAILARLRTNERIKVPQVRLIDQTGQQMGILPTEEALRLARQAGLDLAEVAPRENPPVCKIIDYGRWRYQQQKKEHQSRKKQHTQELKELRIRPKTDRHDRQIKLNRARGFLSEGHKVQFNMIFRGRERLHRDLAKEAFGEIIEQLDDVAKVERDGHFEGRRMIMVLAPKAKKAAGQKSQPAKAEGNKASDTPGQDSVVAGPSGNEAASMPDAAEQGQADNANT